MTNREKYEIYCRMFDRAHELEDEVRSNIVNNGGKAYHVEIHVGKEETGQYIVYIEFKSPTYRYLNGVLLTEEQVLKIR